MTALPRALAVTSPDADTDAMFVAELDHVTDCPERRFPLASFTAA